MIYVYKTWPQDGFMGWTLEEFIAKAACARRFHTAPPEIDDRLLQQFQEIWVRGRDLAEPLGWEGDVRSGYPLISFLPEENDGVSLIIVWKQENDGTSFVISQRRLPWLEDQTGMWTCE
jgi:hypothetical protein